jgi:hypothetical protein
MYVHSVSELKLSISKGMVQQGNEVYFLYERGSKVEIGFREVQYDRWTEELAYIWKELQQVTVRDGGNAC